MSNVWIFVARFCLQSTFSPQGGAKSRWTVNVQLLLLNFDSTPDETQWKTKAEMEKAHNVKHQEQQVPNSVGNGGFIVRNADSGLENKHNKLPIMNSYIGI